jgi:hypothetical protein
MRYAIAHETETAIGTHDASARLSTRRLIRKKQKSDGR